MKSKILILTIMGIFQSNIGFEQNEMDLEKNPSIVIPNNLKHKGVFGRCLR